MKMKDIEFGEVREITTKEGFKTIGIIVNMLDSDKKEFSKTSIQIVNLVGDIDVVNVDNINNIVKTNKEEQVISYLKEIGKRIERRNKEAIKLNKLDNEIKSLISNYKDEYKIVSLIDLVKELNKKLSKNPNYELIDGAVTFRGYTMSLITSKNYLHQLVFSKNERIGRNLTEYDYDFLDEDLENGCLAIVRITDQYHKLMREYSSNCIRYSNVSAYTSSTKQSSYLEVGDKDSLNYVDTIKLEFENLKMNTDSIEELLTIFEKL